MNIRTKLILANLLIVLLLLGSLTYVLVKRSSEIVLENVMENAELSLSQVSANLNNKLHNYENIANTMYLNTSLQIMLQTVYEDMQAAYVDYFASFQPYDIAVRTTQNIAHLKIYTDNPSFVFANFSLIDKDIENSTWYKKALESPYGNYWTAAYNSTFPTERLFSFRQRLNNFNVNSPIVVSLEIDASILNSLINEESKSKRIIFAHADGAVFIDSSHTNKVDNIRQLPFYDELQTNKGNIAYEENGQSYKVLFQTMNSRNSVKGMKVLTFIPVDDLMPKVNQLRSLAVLLFIIACLVSGALIFLFSMGLTRRFTELSSKMKRVHKDNFQSFIEVKGKDEVAQLGQIFNLMVQRLGQMVNEVYRAEIDQKEQALRTKEVELYALQTQINPHFLFNILNMIRGKLLIAGDRENANIVGLLAKSFRMMLKNGGQSIPLAEEIEFIDIYLRLQMYRYVDKFQYEIDIPAELENIDIPKLCLQPLVENAITHGIELKKTKSLIAIRGRIVEDRIVITVDDDGLGISSERLAEINEWLLEDGAVIKDTHIGLKNVHRRLRFLYGDSFGLVVESVLGEGTRITLNIPKPSTKIGDDHV